jgi:hypothetical protein
VDLRTVRVRVAAGLRLRVALAVPRWTAAVRDYLATCETNAGLLSKKYHPTEDGAVKLIFHHGSDEADEIRKTFRSEHRSGSRKGR